MNLEQGKVALAIAQIGRSMVCTCVCREDVSRRDDSNKIIDKSEEFQFQRSYKLIK